FWRSVSTPAGQIALAGFYAALAFAVFSKGPAGLLPLLAAGIWLLTEPGLPGGARGAPPPPRRPPPLVLPSFLRGGPQRLGGAGVRGGLALLVSRRAGAA